VKSVVGVGLSSFGDFHLVALLVLMITFMTVPTCFHFVQVILGNKSEGLTYVSMESSFVLPFPWHATHLAVSCISSDSLAMIAEDPQAKDDASRSWLHILNPGLDAQATWCEHPMRQRSLSWYRFNKTRSKPLTVVSL
jgi:hypothetical protein